MTGIAASLVVALWQCESRPLDIAGNLARLAQQAHTARGRGVDLLVCPEMFLTGYAIGARAVQALAEPFDGPGAEAVARVAQDAGLAIAYGYPERGDTGRIHNAAQLFGADGTRLGRYRKTQLYGELDRAMFEPGDGSEPVSVLAGWRLGLAICYDIEFPEVARRLALAGADLIVVPTANMEAFDQVSRILVPARALENQVFVAYANYCGSEGTLRYGGLSTVSGPGGETVAAAGRDDELLIAPLRRSKLEASRTVFTYLWDRPGGFDGGRSAS